MNNRLFQINIKVVVFMIVFTNLFINNLEAQIYPFKTDGLYKITYHYIPERWELFNFYISPYNPVYITEVSLPVPAYVKIQIFQNIENNNRRIVKSNLAHDGIYYEPAIYNINWSNITDNNKLPVVDGNYELIFSAYSDSTLKNNLYQNSFTFPIILGWKDIEMSSIENSIQYLPGYNVYENKELKLWKGKKDSIVTWKILGARLKKYYISEVKNQKLALSFKLKKNEFGFANCSFFFAKISEDKMYKITKEIGFYRTEIVELEVNRSDDRFLIIWDLGSPVAVIDFENIWKNILKE